ncbi:MAG: DUF2804 domain-containing protein [Pseudomonadota bacterium]
MTLARAPQGVVDANGQPLFGRYCGSAASFDWAALAAPYRRSAWWRHFHHKRWHYVSLATDELFCAVAIVDLGWTSTAFAYAFDRRQRKVVAAFEQDGVPGLSAQLADHVGGASRFRFLSQRIAIEATGPGAWRLTLRCGQFVIDAAFAGQRPLLLAVGAVDGGSVHATQKSPGLALTGEVRIGTRRASLDGGVASIDYSNGLLARETDWRWACAHSLELGFNLQAGYFGANENALWLDGQIIPLAAAHFTFDARDPLAPWQIATADGLLELAFTPEGARSADKNLLVAASHYVQPIGTFNGVARPARGAPGVAIKQLAGVTEDHRSRW